MQWIDKFPANRPSCCGQCEDIYFQATAVVLPSHSSLLQLREKGQFFPTEHDRLSGGADCRLNSTAFDSMWFQERQTWLFYTNKLHPKLRWTGKNFNRRSFALFFTFFARCSP